jgi:arylsulfatase A-like enzyme
VSREDGGPAGPPPGAAAARPRGAWRDLALVTLVGLLTAWGENALRVVAKVAFGQPMNYDIPMWWMTPAADVVLVVAVTGVAFVLTRWLPAAWRERTILAVPLFVAWFTALLYVPRVHIGAQAALAAGLAVQGARLLGRRREWVRRRSPRALLIATLVTAATAIGTLSYRVVEERRAEGALVQPRPDAMNVLLLIWDTVRARNLSLYGYERPTTPGLEALARESVVFDRAIATAPYTLPSHASLFTGRWAHELSTDWRVPLNAEPRTLAEVLRGAGYRTAGFAANRFYVTRAYGLNRGFIRFEEVRHLLSETIRHSLAFRLIATHDAVRRLFRFETDLGRPRAAMLYGAVTRWIAEGKDNRPYFAFVNVMDGHAPFLPRAPYDTLFGWYSASTPSEERQRLRYMAHENPASLPVEEAKRLERAYDGAIAALDAMTTSFIDTLRQRGLLDRTMVIISADHGEEFGEQGVFGHGNSLYFPSLHVPLIVWAPGRVPAGVRVPATVSLRDLPATILDLLQLRPDLPGRSLASLWRGDTALVNEAGALAEVRYDRSLPPSVPASAGGLKAFVTDSLQLIRSGRGDERIFDVTTDLTGATTARPDSVTLSRLRARMPGPQR